MSQEQLQLRPQPTRAGMWTTLALEASLLIAAAGCASPVKPNPTYTPDNSARPTPALATIEASAGMQNIDKALVSKVAHRSIGNFNSVLGVNLDVDQATSKIVLVETLKEFQNILLVEEEGYIPQDESNRLAITSQRVDANGLYTIYLNKKSLEIATHDLPHTKLGNQGRENFLEAIVNHELVHWSAAAYASVDLHEVVFNKMFAGMFKGEKVKIGKVHGAEISAVVNGVRKAAFQNLEEAEAHVISEYIIDNDNTKEMIKKLSAADIGVGVQADLLKRLLTKLGNGDMTEPLKQLAHFRRQTGGREKWALFVAKTLGIPEKDALFFTMSVQDAIDSGDVETLNQLIGISR